MRSLRLLLTGAALAVLVLLAPAGRAKAVQVTEFPLTVAGSSPLGIARAPTATSGSPRSRRAGSAASPPPGRHRVLHRLGHQRGRGAVGHRRRARRQPLVHRVRSATGSGASPRRASSPSSPPASPRAARPRGITAGPDGNLWFTEGDGDRIGRITPAGVVTEFSRRHHAGQPAPRHHRRPGRQPLVHRAAGDRIGRITPAGVGHRVHRRHHRRQPSPAGSPPGPTATSGSPSSPATGSGGSPRRAWSPSSRPASPRRASPERHHGRSRRQPLVHRGERPAHRPHHPGRRRHRVSR